MGTNSISELIFCAIQQSDKPVRFNYIRNYVQKNRRANEGSIRTVLSGLVAKGIVAKAKFPNRSSFYGKPEWFDDRGNIKQELNFDPYFNN